MPTYEYRCAHCGNEFDLVRKMGNHNQFEHCPECDFEAKLTVSRSTVFGEEAAWLNEPTVRGALQDDSEIRKQPTMHRSEYKKLLKDKGIVERG